MRVRVKPPDCPACVPMADLFRLAQAGGTDSLNRLMAEHDGLVQAVVRKQFLGPLSFAEALQAGRIGLWRAILGYDPQRGLAFSTYAWPAIARHVWSAVRDVDRPAPTASALLGTPSADDDPVTAWESASVRAALSDLIACLPSRLRTVVVAHYGLDDASPRSLATIATTMGLCRERIRQLHTEALIWLRHPAHSQHLRSLLDRHTVADYERTATLAQAWQQRRRRRYGH